MEAENTDKYTLSLHNNAYHIAPGRLFRKLRSGESVKAGKIRCHNEERLVLSEFIYLYTINTAQQLGTRDR